MPKGIRLLLLILCLSAVVGLADMRPNRESADIIIETAVKQLRKAGVHGCETGKEVRYYNIKPKLIATQKTGTSLEPPKDFAYRLEYEISPLQGDKTLWRQITMTIYWKPDPAKQQSYNTRYSFTLADTTK